MLTLIVPCYYGGENLERTIASVRTICDEVIVISTALYPEDVEHFRRVADKVVEHPFNFVFLNGFGDLNNLGTSSAKNDWLLLFGVGETLLHPYLDIRSTLANSDQNTVFRCDHVNDVHTWGRVWNKRSNCRWGGIIHEDIAGGRHGPLLFRMQDTDKIPPPDPVKREAIKYLKTLSYNWLYRELGNNPNRLGATNAWWLDFIAGAREGIDGFIANHQDMLDACLAGDLAAYLNLVKQRMERDQMAGGVNYKPLGK